MPTLDFLTGSKGKERTISQFFFQPYESPDEFLDCARHTFLPLACAGVAVLDPPLFLSTFILGGIATCTLVVASEIALLLYDEITSKRLLSAATFIVEALYEVAVGILLLPLSLLVMSTRGLMTGLQKSDVYDYNESVNAPEEINKYPQC